MDPAAAHSVLRDQLSALPGVSLLGRGKVRDLYAVAENVLLVASDRISAYDAVLGSIIPDKGRVLTGLTDFWLDTLPHIVANHRITARVEDFPEELAPVRDQLRGRTMLCRRADVVPVECVARGYLSGSGWAEYQEAGEVCGVTLPAGLTESEQLPEPIFTPATKATNGHDDNVPFDAVAQQVGGEVAERLRDLTLRLYGAAADHAATRGILMADTKFEFGWVDGELTLVDEVCTPDSSRFWPADAYAPGGPQPSYDKQYVRDWLTRSGWNRQPPAPALPPEVVDATRERYVTAYETLTGRRFRDWSP